MTNTNDKPRILANHLNAQQERLIALQVHLNDARRHRTISRKDFQARFHALEKTIKLNRQMFEWASAAESQLSDEENLGLPNLETCSPEERKICLEFMRQRVHLLEGLIIDAAKVLDRLQKPSRWEWLSAMLGLSFLKKTIAKLEMKIVSAKQSEAETDLFLQQLHQKYGLRGSKSDNIDASIRLFNELDIASSRIARLKADVAQEHEQLIQMKQWLRQESEHLQKPVEPVAPPDVSRQLAQLAKPTSAIEQTSHKLDLAQKYIESCIDHFGVRR